MEIGDKIKEIRIEKNMTQDELARMVGYKGRSMICRIETGKNNPSFELLVKIASALNVPPSALLDDDASLLELVAADNGMSAAYGLLQNAKQARPRDGDELDEVSEELVDLLVKLTPQEASKVVGYIQGILAARED